MSPAADKRPPEQARAEQQSAAPSSPRGRTLGRAADPVAFSQWALDAFSGAGLTSGLAAKAGGPSQTTVVKIRRMAAGKVVPTGRGDDPLALSENVLRRIDRAAGLPVGTALAAWNGGDMPRPWDRGPTTSRRYGIDQLVIERPAGLDEEEWRRLSLEVGATDLWRSKQSVDASTPVSCGVEHESCD